ncbi:WD40-repeat-containing domain protein [Blastocladiella britannica]|nr:WD40-repeat-containing domain protein [Blastocladiella britannica]
MPTMDMPLLGPWLEKYPKHIDHTIRDTTVTLCAFNRTGTLLAGGTSTGAVHVWDVTSMQVLASLYGHAAAVTAVSWSRSSRYLATSSHDWQVLVWDLDTANNRTGAAANNKNGAGAAHHVVSFDAPVLGVAFHPIKRNVLLVHLAKLFPVLVTLAADNDNDSHRITPLVHCLPGGGDLIDVNNDSTISLPPGVGEVTALTWDATGRYVFSGTSKGLWRVVDASVSLTSSNLVAPLVLSERTGAAAVRGFALSRSGMQLAITVADKSIRTYFLPYVDAALEAAARQSTPSAVAEAVRAVPFDHVPIHKFVHPIDRLSWTGAVWSASGEFLVGGTAGGHHDLCIWDHMKGTMATLLKGPSEGLIALAWHPSLPLGVTVSDRGTISVWNAVPKDRWSAFVPDFTELEDNIEHEEREDEFDDDPSDPDPLRSYGLRTGTSRPRTPPFTGRDRGRPALDLGVALTSPSLDLAYGGDMNTKADPFAVLAAADPEADRPTAWQLYAPMDPGVPDLLGALEKSPAALVTVQREVVSSGSRRRGGGTSSYE